MAEEIIEFNGAGFIPGVPGMFANCQVVFDTDTKEVLRVEPLGTPPPDQPVLIEQPPSAVTSPVEPSPGADQLEETTNQGG